MELELGKIYETKSGEKVKIYATQTGTPQYHAAIAIGDEWMMTFYFHGGKYLGDGDHPRDIVREWIDSKSKIKLVCWKNYTGCLYMIPENEVLDGVYERYPRFDE